MHVDGAGLLGKLTELVGATNLLVVTEVMVVVDAHDKVIGPTGTITSMTWK
jgi:hypothetical protein